MNILILGNDARSHCIAWKLYQSEYVKRLYAYPGNPGIFKFCKKTDITEDSFEHIASFCERNLINTVIPGPEKYLVHGLYDFLEKRKINVFGPSEEAAKLEGSKEYAKIFMKKYDIPTAGFQKFENVSDLKDAVGNSKKFPIVIKADGLAAGKGVKVCQNRQEAFEHIENMSSVKDVNGKTGKFILEDFLCGEEASLLCFVDGDTIRPMIFARDHKRAFDGDKGDNTGGMGAFSNPFISENARHYINENIIEKTINGIRKEKLDYKGVLFIGLMIFQDKAWVIEYNVRFGDPETQSILPVLKSDLGLIIKNTLNRKLKDTEILWEDRQSVCVVCASGGYPGIYEKNLKIKIDRNMKSLIFYAGVRELENELVTDGGRVLSVVGKGNTIEEARENAYKDIQKIRFKDMHYRKDIAGEKSREK